MPQIGFDQVISSNAFSMRAKHFELICIGLSQWEFLKYNSGKIEGFAFKAISNLTTSFDGE